MATPGALTLAAQSASASNVIPAPDPPTGLTATGDADSIDLEWTPPASGPTPDTYTLRRTDDAATVLYTDSWTGTDGADWSSQWALGRDPSSGGGSTLQGNQGRLTTGDLGGFSGSDRISRRLSGQHVDAEVLVKITNRVVGGFPNFAFRSQATALDTTSGYYIDINARTGYRWAKFPAGGSRTSIGTREPFSLDADTPAWLRARVVGNVLQARMWLDSEAEPTTWPAGTDLVDSDITDAGYLGLSVGGGSSAARVIDFDDLTVTTGAGSADSFTGITGTTYSDTTAVAETTYTYTARSVAGGQESVDSNSVDASLSPNVSRTATAATLTLGGQAASRAAAATARTATASALTLAAQPASRTYQPVAQARTASTASLALTASGALSTVGGLNPLAGTTTLTLTAQAASVQLGSVARASSPAALALTAQTALADNVGGGAQTATAAAASLTLTPAGAAATSGVVARTASPAAVALVAQASSATVAAVARTASPASLILTSQIASRDTSLVVTASPAALSLTSQAASRLITAVSRTASAAALGLTAATADASSGFPVTYPATVLVRNKVRVHLSGGIYL